MRRYDLLFIAIAMLAIVIGVITGGFAFVFILPMAAFVFTVVGLLSCIGSRKETNTKLLWVIVMILAPFLGPLLWFVWGKNQTH